MVEFIDFIMTGNVDTITTVGSMISTEWTKENGMMIALTNTATTKNRVIRAAVTPAATTEHATA